MSCYRQPRTKNELTQYYATITNEYAIPIKVRERRQPLYIPSAWSDLDYCRQRNWKKYRKTQWRK